MHKKLSKKILALALAVLMLFTSLPMTVFAETSVWNATASSDFTNNTWSPGSGAGNSTVETSPYQFPTTSEGGSAIAWTAGYWKENGDPTASANGTYISDGYMYLSDYAGAGTTPVTGATNFMIDIAFRFEGTNSDAVTAVNSYCFIKLGTAPTRGRSTTVMWENNVLAQDAFGRLHIGGDGYNVPSNTNNAIATSNPNLSVNTDYHYIMKYDNGTVTTCITDSAGETIVTLNAVRANVNTDAIASITIGDDDDEYYMRDVNYRSVTFYTSDDPSTSQKYVDADKDKYVMLYFTGNDDNGERLRMAVSDDGLNFEALNGNQAIWDYTKLTSTEEVYPLGAQEGFAETGHVRDPYVLRAQDGSFYVLATDLRSADGWSNNSKLMVWHLDSLADLDSTNPWFIDTQSIMGAACGGSVSRAWAPQAIWDPEVGHYMLYWSVGYITDVGTVMYYAYTDDFKTLLTEPQPLIDTESDNIDGDITYDGSLYYLWFKNESTKTIAYAVSEHASGPYSSYTTFIDDSYGSVFEGPQVYQLHSTGEYVLMADHYASMSYFATYTSNNPTNFQDNNIATNINYLQPRHGSVLNITTAEYNELVEKYGKTVYDSSGVGENASANDYLVARYFTNDDASYDATGNGNTLTTVTNVSMTSNYNGRAAAQFNSNSASSANFNSGSYAMINTTDMFSDYDLNAKDGVTFSWYGYATAENIGRYFDWSANGPGEVVWDGSGYNQNNSTYVYATADSEFGATDNAYVEGCLGVKGSTYVGSWHLFTLTVVDHYLIYSVDGNVIFSEYASNGESVTRSASPYYNYCVTDSLFDTLQNGNLKFGVSSWGSDSMFDGYISDFRVYAKALSNADIQNSLNDLENDIPTTEVDSTQKFYYDPMETTTVDGVDYQDYGSYTVEDEIYGNVLDVTYNNASYYTYNGSSTDSSAGYTISMFYNPGDGVAADNNDCIFYIGHPNANDWNNQAYLQLTENGILFFNYEINGSESYIDLRAFDADALQPNTWTHITIQIVPNGNHDIVYVYFDGNLLNKVDTYTSTDNKNLIAGQSIHEYLALDHSVYYGQTSGYWASAQDGYLDGVSVYNGTYDASDVFGQDCAAIADSLYILGVREYKEAMAALDGADYVYTNMYDAYLAYDRMCRYVDSYTYGTVEADPSKVAQLYSELIQAINNMKVYRTPATVEGYSAANKNAIPAEFTNNMLTEPTGVFTVTEQDGGTYDNTNSRISSSNFVWLYTGMDGDTPIAPYSSGFFKASASATNQYGAAMFISNDVPMAFGGAGLGNDDAYWHQNTSYTDAGGTSTNVNWYYNDYSNMYRMTDARDTYGQDMSANTWYNASGYARFTGDSSTFVASSESDTTYTAEDGTIYNYTISFTPTFRSYKRWQSIFSSDYTDCGTFSGGTGTVQVINYKPVYNALTDPDRLAVISQATSYSPQSMMEIFDAYDTITSQSYLLNSTNQATELAQTIKQQVDTLENVDITAPVPKADYTDAIATADTEITNLNEMIESGESDQYTTSSWTAYENACYAIQEHFTSLDPTDETRDQQYATNQAIVDRLEDNVTASSKVLALKADYTDVDVVMSADGAVELNHQTNNLGSEGQQLYTYSSWTAFENAYADAAYFSKASQAYRNDTEKFYIDYQPNEYGPYIGYNKDGSIVTDLSKDPYYYVYIGEFYDSPQDTEPSQFESGDYVRIDGQFIKLNGCRYYAESVSATELSQRQNDITSTAAGVTAANEDLYDPAVGVIGDYDAYDASQAEAALVDMIAYADDGAAIQGNIDKYGTSEDPAAYSGTPGSPYITVDGVTYKDATQEQTDNATRDVLNTLNTSAKKAYDVVFNVYVDGDLADTQVFTTANGNPKTYGDVIQLNAADVNAAYAGYDISRCEITTTDNTGDKKTSVINTSSIVINRRIQENTVVDLYLAEPVEGAAMVKVQDYFGTSVNVGYAEIGTEITVNGNTISYTDSNGELRTITALNSPYYTFDHFDLGASSAGSSVTVSSAGRYLFTQRGTKSGNMTYTANGGTINGETSIDNVPYNTLLEIAADDTTDFLVWVKSDVANASVGDWHIASYEPNFSTFTADSGFVYQVVTNSNYSNYLTDAQYEKVMEKLPFSFGSAAQLVTENGVEKFRLYCGFSYDSTANIEIVEAGAVYSTTASDESSLIKGGTDCRTVVANSINFTTNTYTVTKTNAGSGNHYMRSYVSFLYSYTDSEGNVYEDVPRIVYGPVVSCEDGQIH